MTAAANMQDARPAVDAARPVAKAKQRALVRFPYQIHSGITPLMYRVIEQWTGHNSHKCEADIVRDALDFYFKQFSPMYRQAIEGNHRA
jgi:hypothetical protein